MKTIQIHLHSLPPGTPPGEPLYLAGNINNWRPDDARFCFQPNGDGSQHLAFQTGLDVLEFKVTRGHWNTAEGNAAGRERPNRVFKSGSTGNELWLNIESWTDLEAQSTRPENIMLLHPNFFIPQLGRHRRIWACLPADYWTGHRQYPVVYMLDGQNLFDNPEAHFGSWGIDQALNRLFVGSTTHLVSRSASVVHSRACQPHPPPLPQRGGEFAPIPVYSQREGEPPSPLGEGLGVGLTQSREQPSSVQPIIIGIENGGERRIDEYSAWKNAEYGGGEGAQFLQFICDTLKPFVDEHLRTLPDQLHTGIMGSSMGGLMALYGALERPDVFGMAGVFSPSLWFSKEIFRSAEKAASRHSVRILLMAGQQESASMVGDMLDLYETLLAAGHADENLHYDLHSDGAHAEWFWAREFEHALRWLFGDMPEHTHGVPDEWIQFQIDEPAKELLVHLHERLENPLLEVRDYCHDRRFQHLLQARDNRISYAVWEECLYSIRLLSGGDLVFSRRVHLNQLDPVEPLEKPVVFKTATLLTD